MTTNNAPTPLRDSAFMEAFLDVVIPPSAEGKMPGAGSLGLASSLADIVEADATFGPLVQAGLRAIQDAALARDSGGLAGLSAAVCVELVEAQAKAQPMLMVGVARYLYPAYYQHPRVLESLGEPPRPPFPEGYEVEPTDPELLAKLRPIR